MRTCKIGETVEVSKSELNYLIFEYAGIIAYREEKGKCYIQRWMPHYRKQIENFLN